MWPPASSACADVSHRKRSDSQRPDAYAEGGIVEESNEAARKRRVPLWDEEMLMVSRSVDR